MAEWNRQTPWRQGHVLTQQAMEVMDLTFSENCVEIPTPPQKIAVVISHDCDLANTSSQEPNVEIIIGRRLPEPNGNYTHAKNARHLHLPFQEQEKPVYFELKAIDKQWISKTKLAVHEPNDTLALLPQDRNILQRWLSARYRRSAFPDEFNARLRKTGLADRLDTILKQRGENIREVFLALDEGQEVLHHSPDDPYLLAIYLIYSTERDPVIAKEQAEKAADSIREAFQQRCFNRDQGNWHNMELTECMVIADEAMTYAMALKLQKWNADHMSLRVDPPHQMGLA